MAVKMKGNLPKSDRNGLSSLETQLIRERHDGKSTIAVVVLGTTGAVESVENDWKPEPVLSIIHVEPIDDEGRETALALLRRGYESRTGRVPLDVDGDDSPEVLAVTAVAGEYFLASKHVPDDRTLSAFAHIRAYTAADHFIGERHVPTELALLDQYLGEGETRFDSIADVPVFLGEVAALILAERGRDTGVAVDAELVEDGDFE